MFQVNLVVRDEAGGRLTALDIAYKIQERGLQTAKLLKEKLSGSGVVRKG